MFNFIKDATRIENGAVAGYSLNASVPRWWGLVNSDHWVLAGPD
jgi:hypothetical protein